MPYQVMLVDDHPLMRKGLRQLIDDEADMQVCVEAEHGKRALELLDRADPDLILLDLHMRELNGLETLKQLRERGCSATVVALTVSDAKEDVIALFKAGADGYLLKDMDPDELMRALKNALTGQTVVEPSLAGHLAAAFKPTPLESEKERLTHREAEVLEQMALGLSNKLIASKLDISDATVKVHVRNILKKLGVKSRTEAAVWALQNG